MKDEDFKYRVIEDLATIKEKIGGIKTNRKMIFGLYSMVGILTIGIVVKLVMG